MSGQNQALVHGRNGAKYCTGTLFIYFGQVTVSRCLLNFYFEGREISHAYICPVGISTSRRLMVLKLKPIVSGGEKLLPDIVMPCEAEDRI